MERSVISKQETIMDYKCVVLGFIVSFLACLVQVDLVNVAKLPSYITACSRSDPNLVNCGIENGKKAIPELLKGDKKLKLPNFLPFHLERIMIAPSNTLNITLTECQLFGLDTINIEGFEFHDQLKRVFKVMLSSGQLILKGRYNINGRVLVLSIIGDGPIEIKLDSTKITYGFDFDLIDKYGKKYMQTKNPRATLVSSRTHYKLDNLFNGNKRLGDEMNAFINENWREVANDLGPSVTETISAIATSIITELTKRIPYDEILLP